MALKLITREYCVCTDAYHCEYICDSKSDLASLPTDVAAGSTCICTEDTSIHILGADDVWYNLTSGGTSVEKPTVTLILTNGYGDRFEYSTDNGKTWSYVEQDETHIKTMQIMFREYGGGGLSTEIYYNDTGEYAVNNVNLIISEDTTFILSANEY